MKKKVRVVSAKDLLETNSLGGSKKFLGVVSVRDAAKINSLIGTIGRQEIGEPIEDQVLETGGITEAINTINRDKTGCRYQEFILENALGISFSTNYNEICPLIRAMCPEGEKKLDKCPYLGRDDPNQ